VRKPRPEPLRAAAPADVRLCKQILERLLSGSPGILRRGVHATRMFEAEWH
jgi:hypothetical protein